MRAIRRVFCVPIARLRAIQHTGAYCPAGQYSAFFASIAHAGNTTRFLCAYCPLTGNTAHWRLLPCGNTALFLNEKNEQYLRLRSRFDTRSKRTTTNLCTAHAGRFRTHPSWLRLAPPPNGKTARCSIYALYISKRKINSRLQVAEQHAFLQLAFQPSLGAFLCQKHRSNQNSA